MVLSACATAWDAKVAASRSTMHPDPDFDREAADTEIRFCPPLPCRVTLVVYVHPDHILSPCSHALILVISSARMHSS